MEFILEFLLELLVEGVTLLVENKKISKWIRYPLWAIIVLLFIFVIGLLFFLGIVLLPKNIGFSILFFLTGILFLIISIKKMKSYCSKKKT